MKSLGVLGTLVWDRIHRHADEPGRAPFEEWGGIAYSLAALSAAAPPGWQVVPLVKVGRDLAAEAHAFLRELEHLAPGSGPLVVPEPNNRVELRYTDETRRCERLTGGVPAWRWDELETRLAGLDALYVNFISGFEISLAEMQRVRAAFAGPIYADLHSLLLGVLHDGERVPRPLASWREWMRCFDAVQLNEDELTTLAGAWGDPWRFAAEALAIDTHLILVTLGRRGAAYLASGARAAEPSAWSAARAGLAVGEPLRTGRIPLGRPPVEGDPTGCGDVWGSTFFLRLLAGDALEAAAVAAHRAAARNAAHRGARGLASHLRGRLPAERP